MSITKEEFTKLMEEYKKDNPEKETSKGTKTGLEAEQLQEVMKEITDIKKVIADKEAETTAKTNEDEKEKETLTKLQAEKEELLKKVETLGVKIPETAKETEDKVTLGDKHLSM